MYFLAHRGWWNRASEKNTRLALSRAFQAGFGVETDIRDLDGELVISHDMPRRGALPLAVMLGDYVSAGRPGTLALNIKSDGLAAPLHHLLNFHKVTDYFCFDMSVPDTLSYLQEGMPVAARLSEYEQEGPLSERADHLWWDAFSERSLPVDRLQNWLLSGKRVCLVSPELHGRPTDAFWGQLTSLPDSIRHHKGLMLCTDRLTLATKVLA